MTQIHNLKVPYRLLFIQLLYTCTPVPLSDFISLIPQDEFPSVKDREIEVAIFCMVSVYILNTILEIVIKVYVVIAAGGWSFRF